MQFGTSEMFVYKSQLILKVSWKNNFVLHFILFAILCIQIFKKCALKEKRNINV